MSSPTQHTCKQCSAQFTIEVRDQEFYQRISAPDPKLCVRCRLQNRLAHRNERGLYQNTCAKCQKTIISMYNPAHGYTVYCRDCWWGDGWDACDYGQEIDWNRSLLQQFSEVRQRVPRLALVNQDSENSDYTNVSADNKDCYWCFAADGNENCSYCKMAQKSKDCFDCSFVYDSELCYECIGVHNCYRSGYLKDSHDSRECWYSIGLRGCSNVFLSRDLHNKEYYFKNEPCSPEEYHAKVAAYNKQQAYQEWLQLNEGRVVKYAEIINSPECTGDNLTNCKRVYESFDLVDAQDSSYCTDGVSPKDCYDCSFFYYGPELCYQSFSMLEPYNVQYSAFVFYSRDVQYGDQVNNSHDIFLSSNVRGKQFVILNKQYTEAEYKELKKKLIEKMTADGEYGEILPLRYSVFAYNDTVAQEYFPLTAETAKQVGARWNPEADKAKPFKLTKAEQVFYKEMGLPEPTEHPNVRHARRMALRNPRKLWPRHCSRCSNKVMSTYKVERPEVVLCETCYLKEVY